MQYSALIITALFEELSALLEVTREFDWKEDEDPDGFRYHYAVLPTKLRRKRRIAAAWAGEMGEIAASARSRSLTAYLNPRCLAMCGICAGRRGDVFLGDVIVANQVFSYDHGKIIANVEEDTQLRQEHMLHDITTYNLRRDWAMNAKYFSTDSSLVPSIVENRPLSMAFQRRWLLDELYKHENQRASHPIEHVSRKKYCPNWKEVVEYLESQEQIAIEKGLPRLLDSGIEAVERQCALFPDGIHVDPPFQIHVAPIGTGKTVRKDPEIFNQLARYKRSVLGLEMEAVAIGYVAEQSSIPAIIVKAVADYGDHDKDDSFHEFAAKASAEFLISFLIKHPVKDSPIQSVSPRRRHQLPSQQELLQMFKELGYSDNGPNRIEFDVPVNATDSRDDEIADVCLSVRDKRAVVITMNEDSQDQVTGLLCAIDLGVPFYLGINIVQARLVKVDQPEKTIAIVSTSEFVNSQSARARIVAPHKLSYAYLSENSQTAFEIPPTTELALDQDPKTSVMEFFRGYSDSWTPIQMGVPVDIDVLLGGRAISVSDLRSSIEESTNFVFLKIFGPGGSGKTTVARKMAYELRIAGHIVLYRLPNSVNIRTQELRRSAKEYREMNRRLFLFWDSPTMPDNTRELLAVVHALQAEQNVTIVVTEREDEWNAAMRKFPRFRGEQVVRIQERLNDRQAQDLFDQIAELDRNGYAILSDQQTVDGFRQALTGDANHILLSAVYEATTGERFESILISEFRGIPDDDAKELYHYLCGLFTYGVLVPEELLRRMYGRVYSRRLRNETLVGILYARQQHIWPRHRTIAELLWKALNSETDAEIDVFHDFLSHLKYQLKETDEDKSLNQFCFDFCQHVIHRLRSPVLICKAADSLSMLSTNSTTFQSLGKLLMSLGRKEEAISIYELIIQKYSNSSLFEACGRAYLDIGQPEKAIETFETGIATTPNSSLFAACGRAYLDIGQPEKAIETFETGIATTPNSSLFAVCGRAYQEIGQPEKAIETFETGIATTPNPNLFAVCGRAYLDIGQPEKAIETFETGIATTPNSSLFEACGRAYQEIGQPEKAIETFETGIATTPNPNLFAVCGRAYQDIGQPEKAIETFETGIATTPNSSLFEACGRAYQEIGQLEKAIETFETGIATTPNYRLFEGCGRAYQEIGQLEKAIETFETGIATTPNSNLFEACGRAYLDIGQPEKAIETFETGIATTPIYYRLFEGCGRAYQEIGKPEKAIETLEEGIKKITSSELYLFLGRIYEEIGEIDKSEKMFEKSSNLKVEEQKIEEF